MNAKTWHHLVGELAGRTYSDAYFWTPRYDGPSVEAVTSFYGVPILIKNFIADDDILVGV